MFITCELKLNYLFNISLSNRNKTNINMLYVLFKLNTITINQNRSTINQMMLVTLRLQHTKANKEKKN